MTKTLIAGLATIVVAGTALIGTGMYAASGTTTTSTGTQQGQRQGGGENMIASLSGKVSAESLTALTTLMAKHKAEMDAAKASGTTIDSATRDANRAAFKTEMDALMTKYPELKTAMDAARPVGGKDGGRGGKMGGKNHAEIDAIIATLPTTTQTELKSIRDSYKTKEQALRTEEKSKIDAVLAAYPEAKAKLDALRPTDGGNRGPQGGNMGSGSIQK